MKKVRNLRFLGIVGVIIAVVFLMSISFTQSQVRIQKGKPVKPPDDPPATATWAVQLPTLESSSMFYGMGSGLYEDNGANIEVSVSKNQISGPYKKFFSFTYAFDFILTNDNLGTGNPPTDQVGFQNVSGLYLDVIDLPDPGNVGIFPVGGGILAFLNNLHPYSDGIPENAYESIWLEIHIFDQDIELMELGEIYTFGSDRVASDPGDYFSIWARYRGGCSPEIYHDVELYRSINVERAAINGNTPNIEIERMDDNTWRFWIKSDGDGYLKVRERYCTIVKRKARTVYSMEAKANFDFYFDFIKISN